MAGMDWGAIFGVGGFAGVLALVAGQIVKAISDRRKVAADAGVREADRDISLSDAAVAAMERLTANYESRLHQVQEDARAQIAGARADATNSVATALHEVSTARAETNQARRAMEDMERTFRYVRIAVWSPGPDDPRIVRARELVGDGSSPGGVAVNSRTLH